MDTVLFHFNALTGEDALGKSPSGTVLQGVDIISGPLLGAYQLPGNTKAVILLDELLQVRIDLSRTPLYAHPSSAGIRVP